MRRRIVLAAAVMALGGCAEEFALESASDAIVGGTIHEGSPAVVLVSVGGGCTGTLIAPQIVVTAGHCIEGAVRAGITTGRVRFGPGGGVFEASRDVSQLALHREYGNFLAHDVALIRLRDPAPENIEPMPLNIEPLPDMLGAQLRVVGYGLDDGAAGTGFGTKRHIILEVVEQTGIYLGIGSAGRTTCNGDSGGPSFFNIEGQGETVVAVTSFGAEDCLDTGIVARTDPYKDNFFIPILDAWDGPCKHDGVCVEDCPRTPDPDCGTCGFDGFCDSACASPDLDCPLGGLAGASCNDDFDCEGRTCVTSLDGASSYCSAECTEATVTADCDAPLSVCVDNTCHIAPDKPKSDGGGCNAGRAGRSSAGAAWVCVFVALLLVRTGRSRRRRRSRCRRGPSRPAAS